MPSGGPVPRPTHDSETAVFFLVGPQAWGQGATHRYPNSVLYTREECLQTLLEGQSLPFFDGPFDEVAFVLCLEGWCGFAQPPRPETSAPAHHHSLTAETLGGDLLRFALRLWSQGTPTMLLFSPPSASAVAPFSEIRHLQQREQDGLRFLINAWQGW